MSSQFLSNLRILLIGWMILLPGSASALSASLQNHSTDTLTGIHTWSIRAQGILFSLTQILPEQLQAFYVNRGFTLEQIQPYVTSCVFMAVLRNDTAAAEIHYLQQQWSIISGDNTTPPTILTHWLSRLEKSGVGKSALLTFRWAQFPAQQTYQPGGDWNQGMLSVGLPEDRLFNMVMRWNMLDESHEMTLKGVRCAK